MSLKDNAFHSRSTMHFTQGAQNNALE